MLPDRDAGKHPEVFQRTAGRRAPAGLSAAESAVLPSDNDGHVVGTRRDQVSKAVARHVSQAHAPARIAADVDRCCARECAIPATPEQPDGLGRPIDDQKVREVVGIDVLQSNGVRVRRDVDAECRVVPAFEGPSGDPEEQGGIVRLVVCDREVGKPVLVEIRDGQVHRILPAGPDHVR